MRNRSGIRKKPHPFKWFIWLIAVTFYFYEYMLRVSPSILVPELIQTFRVDAATVGVISAFYYYAYAPMQVPAGILTDRYGARRLLVLATIICGLGGVLFAMAHTIFTAELGRFCLGIGSAFGFIGMVYITTHWFEKKRWSLLIGIGNSIGMMGAVVGEGPMSFAVSTWGFRSSMFVLGVIAFGITLLVLAIVRNQPKEFHQEDQGFRPSFWLSLKIVLLNKRVWVVSLVCMWYYLAVVAFGALWGVPFFRAANGFSQETASFATSMIYFGFVIGGPIIGHIGDKLGHKKQLLVLFLGLTVAFLSCLVYLSPLPGGVAFFLVFFIGFCSAGSLFCYPLGIETASDYVKGTVIAFINAISFIGASIVQPVIGSILDARSVGADFTLEAFQAAFSVFVAIAFASFIGSFFILDPRKKEAKQSIKKDDLLIEKERKSYKEAA